MLLLPVLLLSLYSPQVAVQAAEPDPSGYVLAFAPR